jgi:hypothetical protein
LYSSSRLSGLVSLFLELLAAVFIQPITVTMNNSAQPQHNSHTGESQSSDMRPTVVGMHFRVGKKIGEGSFGIIHEGI